MKNKKNLFNDKNEFFLIEISVKNFKDFTKYSKVKYQLMKKIFYLIYFFK